MVLASPPAPVALASKRVAKSLWPWEDSDIKACKSSSATDSWLESEDPDVLKLNMLRGGNAEGGECVGVNEIFNVFASGGGGGWILECLKLVELGLAAWGPFVRCPQPVLVLNIYLSIL